MKDNIKNNLIEDFQLPKYVKGKTFADASKAIDNKFKDRKDTFATQTKEELLERLANAQEYVKMQDALKNQSQEVPDMMNGQIPPGMEEFVQPQGNQFAYGGNTEIPDTGLSSSTTNSGMGNGLVKIGGAIGGMLGTPQEAEYASEESKAPSQFMNTAKDAVGSVVPMAGLFRGVEKGVVSIAQKTNGDEGAAISQAMFSPSDNIMKLSTDKDLTGGERAEGFFHTIFNPIGAGAMIHKGNQRRKMRADLEKTYQTNNQFDNDFAMGGYINNKKGKEKMMYGGYGEGEEERNPNIAYTAIDNMFGQPINYNNMNASTYGDNTLSPQLADQFKPSNNPSIYPQPEGSPQAPMRELYKPQYPQVNMKSEDMPNELFKKEKNNTGGKGLDWLGQNYGDIMSYAPVIGSLTQKIDKPNTARGTRLDNTYQRQLVDETALQNNINQNNIQGALTNNSGGDLGALRSNLIAGNLAKTKALSDAYLRAEDMNRNENRTAQQFNLNRDMTNLQQDERYIERKAQDEAAYSGAIADRRQAVLDNIGNIGREESNKQLVKQLFGYTWNGKYWTNSEGNKVSAKKVAEAKKTIADAQKDNKKDKE